MQSIMTVTTDTHDYAPGAWVEISATGIDEGATVQFSVQHASGPGADGQWGTPDDMVVDMGGAGHEPWAVTDGGDGDLDGAVNGAIVTSWYVNPDDSIDQAFLLTASVPGQVIATTGFTDATGSTNKVYQHWADGDAATGSSAEWNNNILNANKSDYFEGEVIPHVFIYKASSQAPLEYGKTYSFNVTYNYYQQNTDALGFDFLTTFDASRTPGQLDVTMPAITPTIDAAFVNGGGFDAFGGGAQGFYTVDADITNVSSVTTLGSGTLNHQVTITFVYTGVQTSNGVAEIYYGLHIAAPTTTENGASAWSGGSLQTTVDIGGSGATSIQLAPAAIIAGSISGYKFGDVNGNGIWDQGSGEQGIAGWTIFLDADNDGYLDSGETIAVTDATGRYSFSVTPDADKSTPLTNDGYVVREVNQAGWTQTTANPAPIVISVLDPTELNVNFGNMLMSPSLEIAKQFVKVTGGDEDGQADWAGEVLHYTVTVKNTGNVTLTGVTVVDPLTGLDQLVGALAVGESREMAASYTLTQADLDTRGGGDGDVDNTAEAVSDQTPAQRSSVAVPLGYGPSLEIAKQFVKVTGGDEDGQADWAGEVLHYTVTVKNTGNVTLTGVTVVDPLTGLDQLVGALAVGESREMAASYTLIQADLDTRGGGDGDVDNTAEADSVETDPVKASAFVPLGYGPSLEIAKQFVKVTGGDEDGQADWAGEVLHYTVTVKNTGNVTLTGVTVVDPLTGQDQLVGTLAVGESREMTASYTLIQADLDTRGGGDGDIDNTAEADSVETDPVKASAFVPLVYAPSLTLDKVTTINGITGDNLIGVTPNQAVTWTYTVKNTGNVSLANIVVSDDHGTPLLVSDDFAAQAVLAGGFNSGDANMNGILDPNEVWSYTASGMGIASGTYNNIGKVTATAPDSQQLTAFDSSSYTVKTTIFQVTPTGTTVEQYALGAAKSFQDYYAYQGGVVQYAVKSGVINQTNPGVFFYYTGANGLIKGADANSDNKIDPISIKIDQTVTSTIKGAAGYAYLPTLQSIQLYKVNDLNGSGKIDAGDTFATVVLADSQIKIVTSKSSAGYGDVFIHFTPDAVGSMYIASVKYSTATVVGQNLSSLPTFTYNYETKLLAGTKYGPAIESGSLKMAPKASPMLLDGEVGDGARAISDGQLAHVLQQAVAFWNAQGISAEQQALLDSVNVDIADLDGAALGYSQDGQVTVDDDGAGHGWSLGIGSVAPDKVDLFSVLVHEMGHLLGLDDDDMGNLLEIGERALPQSAGIDAPLPLPATMLGLVGAHAPVPEAHFG